MKRLAQILLIGVLFCLIAHPLFGQDNSNYYFNHIDGENGLSASNVKAVLQDSYGFMWFGTKNGLNRYDGTSILQLNCKDLKTGTGNNNIAALFEDKEHKLWVGTDRGIYIYDPEEDTFTLKKPTSPDGVSPDNWVAEILSDTLGNIWSLIPDQGIFCFRKDKMDYYPITDKVNFKNESPNCICTNEKGEIWVGTSYLGLFKYNVEKNLFEQHAGGAERTLIGKRIESICFQGDDLILAIHDGELLKYTPATCKVSPIPLFSKQKTFLRDVLCVDDEIWVGSHHGLYVVNEKRQSIVHLKQDLMRPFSLSDNFIYNIYQDHNGGVWVSTMFGGVNYLPKYPFFFDKYVPGSDGNSLNTKRIRGLAEDNKGNIWIGTEDGGINVLNPLNSYVFQVHNQKSDYPISLCVEHYDDKMYCGLFKQGMDIFNLSRKNIFGVNEKPLGIEEGSVYSFLIDSKERKWIGAGWGLYRAEANKNEYIKLDTVGYNWIFDLFEASNGMIWIATMGNGLWKYNPETEIFHWYEAGRENLSSNSVSSIMEDRKGNIWLSTDRGGICRYDESTDDFTTFTIKDGLPDDVAYDILEDDNDNLWFGTNKGLVKFNPETKDIRVFTTKDGLLGNQFSYKSALKAKDNRFYFGGINGLIAFDPHTAERDQPIAPVYISKLSIFNKEVTVHTPGTPLKKSIIHTDKITLPYNQSSLSFDVALLSYSTNQVNQYYYRMDPLDKEWIPAVSNQNISYAQLAPGKYTFRVRATASGKSTNMSSCSLAIVILPPWWQSIWAYLSYITAGMVLLYACLFWYNRRRKRQMEARQKVFEMEKEKELYESKVKFFTEIAHEIRTPLSLINGPLEAIQEMDVQESGLKKYIRVMTQNTKRLLELTGQLLDFQKISANKLTMKFESVDITHLLKETIARFEVTIALNKKELIQNLEEEHVWAAVDKEAITKIVSNLLNNALKYTRKTIVVELKKSADTFTIRIISDGNKIPKEVSQQIFEPFYQTDKDAEVRNGVGIGLSLARSLALLHKGSLFLDTKQEDNVFVLTVPLNKEGIILENDKVIQKDIVVLDEETSVTTYMNTYTLLLVEDNEDMLQFMQSRLDEFFTTEIARNGKEALEVLRSANIDLIICDIMMPVMNGYQLCREVKCDINLSHIPIIFLTAKNDLESKINGLKYGAEAYIEKPFAFNYLKEQILSLLDNRRREREAFSKRPFFSVNNMQMNKADEAFMNKVIQIIEDNITNDNFSVERMAEILHMSHSSLLRKIKTLFNLSPLDFIRLIKLKKAAEYIQDGKYRIGDICYMIGINSPSYFSKLFLKQFGMTPKDFEKQYQNGNQFVIVQEIKKTGDG
ncbi:hybrid sensor histidine kinase/response regulator transcription factor [Bacteroides sp. 51]|uniref:hybrid sensor histidine kinase/response regulator transcription factor n=1 Tax=Bacteroides sp. 51 TaxID=2302938 RepID=UPI0013D79E18|nr:hybrid sensor histidine kinase/response regulator transcription factor [Bacteroides sp. 51]NDV80989.1 hybrid sensor histidine kinase/response regulator [Bacteroides sp. 51]